MYSEYWENAMIMRVNVSFRNKPLVVDKTAEKLSVLIKKEARILIGYWTILVHVVCHNSQGKALTGRASPRPYFK